MLISNKLQHKNESSVVLTYHTSHSVDFKRFSWQEGHGVWFKNELIIHTYSKICPALLIYSSDLITANCIVKLLKIVVQVPSCGF